MDATAARATLPADLGDARGVVGFTTLRHGLGGSAPPFDAFNLGLRSGDAADDVVRNRAALIERCGLPSAPRWLRQVHGTRVLIEPGVDEDGADAGGADAAITRTAGVVLAILTADCLPVVLAARDGSEVAVAHAGWRGLAAGVLEATVDAMQAPRDRIHAWLGPAAGAGAYEIGREVFDAFTKAVPGDAIHFTATRENHWRVDLAALARRRLADAGVMQVAGGGLCTISDAARFFSHRRAPRTGRMATLAWLR